MVRLCIDVGVVLILLMDVERRMLLLSSPATCDKETAYCYANGAHPD